MIPDEVRRLCQQYQKHIMDVESDKYDLEKDLAKKELEVRNDLDLRGEPSFPKLSPSGFDKKNKSHFLIGS